MSIALSLMVVLPPPPITVTRTPNSIPMVSREERQKMLTWSAGEVVCSGVNVSPVLFQTPMGHFRYRRFKDGTQFTLSFAIADDGRTHSIDIAGKPAGFGGSDFMPSLAASRFAKGEQHSDCSVTYTAKRTALADSKPYDIAALAAFLGQRRMPKDAQARFPENTCGDKPKSKALVRHYPDYRTLTGEPGVPHWTFVNFDLDGNGSAANAQATYSSGHRMLDQMAVAVTSKSRETGANRTGCKYTFSLAPATLAAPPKPDKWSKIDRPAACDADDRWEKKPRLIYPSSYQKRAIEGWAVFKYDVAPWGEIGSVEILDSQPSSDMGRFGKNVLKSARYKPVAEGLTGCIETVRFALNLDSGAADESAIMSEVASTQ